MDSLVFVTCLDGMPLLHFGQVLSGDIRDCWLYDLDLECDPKILNFGVWMFSDKSRFFLIIFDKYQTDIDIVIMASRDKLDIPHYHVVFLRMNFGLLNSTYRFKAFQIIM